MKALPLCAALLVPALAQAEGAALSGPTGLLTVPTAQVTPEGEARLGMTRHDSVPPRRGMDNYLFTIGFLPGLELGGRLADFGQGQTNDLSFHAKYSYRFESSLALAVGGQDIGGEAPNFRSRYAVATLPWRQLAFTAGYQWGPDLPQGALGGLEWRPFSVLGIYAEYDTEEINPGFKVQSPPLWAGLRVGANAGWRTASDEVEGGIELSIPLGGMGMPPYTPPPLDAVGRQSVADIPPGRHQEAPVTQPQPPERPLVEGRESQAVRSALEQLGFESVRTGAREGGVLVVSLENRRYNHSAVDGIGLALGTIATLAPPQVERIELTLLAYGVPQLSVATPAQAYRDFLRDGVAPEWLIDARYTGGPSRETQWHNSALPLRSAELVVEPVLRSFVATEYGMLDVGLGARARLTAPLGQGAIGHVGLQVPLVLTGDFRDGENFEGSAPEAGIDLLLLQRVQKLAPSWTWLWSVGSLKVVQADLALVGLEQVWASPEGRHRLNAKLFATNSGEERGVVALGGYTLFDATRNYSVGLTGGQFLAEDTGLRLDVSRYFGDTIAGVFIKYEGRENMAGGFSLSVPLTPRRDAMPRGVQVKGPRRWGHSLQTTLNLADQTNSLRPFLLFEPLTDLDLRRDFYDSGRLGPEYLRAQLPRMREAWQIYSVMPAEAGIQTGSPRPRG